MRLTLATALLAICLPAQGEGLQDRIDDALEKARPVLLEQLGRANGGQLALLCLAAVHDEVPSENEVFAHAIERLARASLNNTYELSIRLMVMAEYPEFPGGRTLARSDLQKLVGNRFQGAFTYNREGGGRWDLSNTQYGALGMRAAESLGFNISNRIWRDLLRSVTRLQSPSGGFGYTLSNRSNTYSSMTVAGIAVLQISKQYLGGQVPTSLKVDDRLEAAWTWMDRNVKDIGDPAARRSYYFHYGLERAAILSDVVQVDSEDWYERGAEMLVEQQLENGGWGARPRAPRVQDPRVDPVSTSFAVLFLRRKFQKMAVPITPGGGLGMGQLNGNSSDADVQKVVDRELVRGMRAIPDMLRAMRSEVVARRKVAVTVILRLSGEDFGFNPYRDAEQNREAIKAAELWWLKSKGSNDEEGGKSGKAWPAPL